jgi:hypothetical protein
MGAFEYQNIVELIQWQNAGGGTTSTAGLIKNVLAMNNDTISWVYDDTLIGKGQGGADLVIITMPKVKKISGQPINTNEFASVEPGIEACTLMYNDMAAPREIPTPIAGGAIDILSEQRTTCGWGVRPEAVTLISMTFQ